MPSVDGRAFSNVLGVAGVVLLIMLSLLSGGAQAQQSPSESDTVPPHNPNPIEDDAALVAADLGISVDEARAALERQPRVGELESTLTERGPKSFGGLFINMVPEYKITILVPPGQSADLKNAAADLGFSDLQPFVVVTETPYTLQVLHRSMEHVRELARGKLTSLDLDIRTGEILATAAKRGDTEDVRASVASTVPPVEARRVLIQTGTPQQQDSYGGLSLTTCTSGFSVRRTTDNLEGLTTAGHCQQSQTLQKHGTELEWLGEKDSGSQDVQWHRTPGMADPNKIRYSFDGTTRSITSRTARSSMSVGGVVFHFGKSSGYGWGDIASKTYDLDGSGSKYNATFIRVVNDDTSGGDSGGPWFVSNSAYGTHWGTSPGGDPVFMAQNYMSALNLVVKTSP